MTKKEEAMTFNESKGQVYKTDGGIGREKLYRLYYNPKNKNK